MIENLEQANLWIESNLYVGIFSAFLCMQKARKESNGVRTFFSSMIYAKEEEEKNSLTYVPRKENVICFLFE